MQPSHFPAGATGNLVEDFETKLRNFKDQHEHYLDLAPFFHLLQDHILTHARAREAALLVRPATCNDTFWIQVKDLIAEMSRVFKCQADDYEKTVNRFQQFLA